MAAAFITIPSPPGTPSVMERRAEERFPCQVETCCHSDDRGPDASRWQTTVQNISKGGLGLTVHFPVESDSSLIVELPSATQGLPRKFMVRVIRATPEEDGSFQLGCAFTRSLSEEERLDIDEIVMDTWRCPVMPPALVTGDSCLVNIYPTGPGVGTRCILGSKPIIVGRGEDCDIGISDHSVSRRHARIEATVAGYRIEDLHSTNGTFVNNVRVSVTRLMDGDYLRVGGSIFRFLAGGNIEAQYHEEIVRLTIQDPLTEAYNKRYLLQYLQREFARAARYRRPLALLLLDIDHFKAINDEFGHLAGDLALQQLARHIRTAIREEEVFARFGGDEFVIVVPEAGRDEAVTLAGRLCQLVADQTFSYEETCSLMTISIGVALTGDNRTLSPTELLEQADQNLLEAKRRGRNQVVA